MHSACLSAIGPTSHVTPTSRRWLRVTSPLPTYGAAASPARTSQSPARAQVSTTASVPPSGGPGSGWCAWYDPASSSWRTWQLSLLGGWETYSGAFPKQGTMRSGRLSGRSTWALRTEGFGSSSSPTIGTPTAAMKVRSGPYAKGRLPNPAEMVTWQMPVADDSVARVRGKMNSRGEPKLSAQVMLPTPSATPYGSNQGGGMGRVGPARPSLSSMAKSGMWPTPTAGDSKASGSRNTPQSKAHSGTSLTDWVRGDGGAGRTTWPTPRASDAERGGRGELLHIVKGASGPRGRLWPTPRVSMVHGPSEREVREGDPKRRLETAVLVPPWRPIDVPTTGGQLNPTWVEWLMGFPLGWTACDASATPSSPSAPRSSGAGCWS